MSRFDSVLGTRRRRITTGAILIALAMAFALPAFGTWGSSPSKECADKSWNGKYWKAEFKDDLKLKDIESNVSKSTVSLSVDKHKKKIAWKLDGGSEYALFRIYEKAGKHSNVSKGFWLPGDSGRLDVSKSLSHITFCFTDIPEPEVSITKTTNGADPVPGNPVSNFIPAGERVEWKYVVKNTGTVELKNIVVTDDREGKVGTHDGVLKPGKSVTFTKKGKAETSAYPVGYSNVATVVAKSKLTGKSVQATDSSGYYGSAPAITLAVVGPDAPVLVGTVFQWSFTITNPGNVPLSAVVVRENDATVGNCDLGILAPGATATCTFDETATLGQESSTFEARGVFDDGVTKTVVFETIAGVEYEVNQPPIAGADTFATSERDEFGPVTLTVAAPGVLENDSDPDGDPLAATPAAFSTSEGASVTLAADGSFTYLPTPRSDAEWQALGSSSYQDQWTYTVNDPKGGSAEGTVTITVSRQLCVEESVSSPAEETVFATFTLTAFDGCKDFPTLEVEATAESLDGTVLFQPPTQDDNGEYRGALTVREVAVDFSDLDEVVLRYDTTPGGVEVFELVPTCAGSSAAPALPGGATTGWCFYDIDFDLNDGLWDITWFIYGIDDPKFVFK